MLDKFEQFMLGHALTKGGRYVSSLGAPVRVRNSSQAHQQHLRFWTSVLKCKEVHIGVSDYNDEKIDATVYSFVDGFMISRAFSRGKNGKFELLSVDKEKASLAKVGETEWMKFCPKLNSEWTEYESNFNYKSRNTTLKVSGETANVMSATYDVWNFPALTWEYNIVYGSDEAESTSSSCLFRRFRIG